MSAFWKDLKSANAVDLRGLGAFRLVLGIILLAKFAVEVPLNFHEVYSPETGMLGKCFAENFVRVYQPFNPLFLVSSDFPVQLLVVALAFLSFCFAAGFYPRLAALIGSVLLWLFHDRYQMLWFGWEQYAQVLLFISIFLPVEKKYSFFNYSATPKDKENSFSSPFVFLLLFQVGMIYFFNGISKNGDRWMDGTAVQFAVGHLDKRTGAGDWLLQQDILGKMLNWLTLIFEILLLPALFCPWKKNTIRFICALSIPSFHWGLSIFMDVGYFKFVSIAVCFLLLPSTFWNKVPGRLREFPKWRKELKIPFGKISVPQWVKTAVASFLIFVIVVSNLKQSLNSKTDDRMKAWLGGGTFQSLIGNLTPGWFPRYSFFGQHWHLFSPNPPGECGYIRVELKETGKDAVPIFSGEEVRPGELTNTVKFLYSYLAASRNNKKEEIFANCLANREVNLWDQKHKGSRIENCSLVLYSWRPGNIEELKAGPQKSMQRIELIRLAVDY